MWTERAPQETIESKVFPRILAMAEVLWRYPAERNYVDFLERVDYHYTRLDALNVKYGEEGTAADIETYLDGDAPGLTVRKKNPRHQLFARTSENEDWRPVSPEDKLDFSQMPMNTVYNVQFMATRNDRLTGEIQQIDLCRHLGLGSTITLSHSLKENYQAGGNQALADGVLGSDDGFNDGRWQGTFGQDVVVTAELTETKAIKGFSCRFFQYQNSWIFLPDWVQFSYSSDGVNWIEAETIKRKRMPREGGKFVEAFKTEFKSPVSAKYIKMKAHNQGQCPEWHDAAGQPSWLFCDELVVY